MTQLNWLTQQEQRRQAASEALALDVKQRRLANREWTKRHQAGKLGHMRRKQRSD